MGKRDIRHREPRKSKKEKKKSMPPVIVTPPIADPEVAGKRRPTREES